MDRETINLITPLKNVSFVIKSYITGGETIEIEAATADSGMKSINGKTGDINMRAEDAYRKRLRKLVDLIVVSAGEEKETDKDKVWAMVCNLVSRDYLWIMEKINQVCEGLTIEEEKK